MKSNEEIIQAYEQALKEEQSKNQPNPNAYQQIQYQEQKQNLVEFELDFTPELVEIARSLRCDILKIENGNEQWIQNPNKDRVFLNELGVNDVLRKIYLLVNKNKVLSNYTIEEIRKRVKMIGHELRALIYNNYEKYGIDNEYKVNNFSSIVLDVLDIIESAYRRALGGETHKGLAEQRLVSQSENVSPTNYTPQYNQNKSKVHWYNPATWGN